MTAKDENCERDCDYYCTGCDRSFCVIKEEEDLPHEKELIESHGTNSGNYYCHSDCGR